MHISQETADVARALGVGEATVCGSAAAGTAPAARASERGRLRFGPAAAEAGPGSSRGGASATSPPGSRTGEGCRP
jgi:hypothetical protein